MLKTQKLAVNGVVCSSGQIREFLRTRTGTRPGMPRPQARMQRAHPPPRPSPGAPQTPGRAADTLPGEATPWLSALPTNRSCRLSLAQLGLPPPPSPRKGLHILIICLLFLGGAAAL